jgi:hypothetical protein
MEPFDVDIFNARRAAWEVEHPESYAFFQRHKASGMYLSGNIGVVNDIQVWPSEPFGPINNDLDPWLRCSTISELYEKPGALWIEQRGVGASFLIEYDGQCHYPKNRVV